VVSRETPGPAERVAAAAEALGVPLTAEAAATLVAVVDRMLAQPQNLTAIDDLDAALERHVADGLAGAALREIADAGRLVDVGAGGGFPGLALAAALPDLEVTLVESERRKAEWLVSVSVSEIFPNVRVVHARSEDLARRSREGWDVATARALAPAPSALELCAPLVAVPGAIVLWAGPEDPEADRRADAAAELLGLAPGRRHAVSPFPGADRRLAVHAKRSPTPERFPRRPGRATKRPLA
jgi:16S rRNA (guanine527-N7)-methyltransferase